MVVIVEAAIVQYIIVLVGIVETLNVNGVEKLWNAQWKLNINMRQSNCFFNYDDFYIIILADTWRSLRFLYVH